MKAVKMLLLMVVGQQKMPTVHATANHAPIAASSSA
jgi:hypothetical protein